MAYNDKKETIDKSFVSDQERQFGLDRDERPGLLGAWWRSCGFAWEGIVYTFKHERNFKIHLTILLGVVLAGLYFQIQPLEWALLLLCFALVLGLELLNTAVEVSIDLVTDYHWHGLAKVAKDVAAGAVLMAAFLVAGVGLVIFWPYLSDLLQSIIS